MAVAVKDQLHIALEASVLVVAPSFPFGYTLVAWGMEVGLLGEVLGEEPDEKPDEEPDEEPDGWSSECTYCYCCKSVGVVDFVALGHMN